MNEPAASMKPGEPKGDDRSGEGLEQVLRLWDEVFDQNVDQLALALGRPVEEVKNWISGGVAMDEDAVEKVNALAQERAAAREVAGGE